MWPFRFNSHSGLCPFRFMAFPDSGLFSLQLFRFVAISCCVQMVISVCGSVAFSVCVVVISVCGSVAFSVCDHFCLWLFQLWPFQFVAVMTCYLCGKDFLKRCFFIFKHWTEIVKSGAISGWNDELQILKQIITYIIYCSTTEMKKYFHGMSLKSSYSYIILQWQFSIMIGNVL